MVSSLQIEVCMAIVVKMARSFSMHQPHHMHVSHLVFHELIGMRQLTPEIAS